MNKLRNKVFSIVFVSLSVFAIGISLRSNMELYAEKQRSVVSALNRLSIDMAELPQNKMPADDLRAPKPQGDFNDGELRRVFLDSIAYTVIIGEDGGWREIISHTFEAENDIDIEDVARGRGDG